MQLAARQLLEFIRRAEGQLVVLTGAGVSTASGIPDYRGPTGIYVRNKDYRPIQYGEFIRNHSSRQRYWARSFLGWPRIEKALPNSTHECIRTLLDRGFASPGVITQNVDGLHGKAKVLELHGTLHEVHCTSRQCSHVKPRKQFQDELSELNPQLVEWMQRYPERIDSDVSSSVNPDGDVEITWNYDDFRYPACKECNSIIKPSVVFFGENIRDEVRDKSFKMIDEASALLVVGSSLQVYSAFRLLKRAKDRGIPVAVVNLGAPRGIELVDTWINESSELLFPRVVQELTAK
ncbi:NAD-dependent protein lipoamidase sirtuin-4 [Phlyctochytrium bullatum]|nr:NAD-dependent protein lipoamidase sirtuin-4 [Phlyctochytrium bullatum]